MIRERKYHFLLIIIIKLKQIFKNKDNNKKALNILIENKMIIFSIINRKYNNYNLILFRK